MNLYGEFYSPERAVSYGRPWIFSVGSRGIGKSTGWAIYILKRFLDHGEHMIYVRRTEDELMKTCRGWFGNAASILSSIYTGLKVIYDKERYFVEWEGHKKEEFGRALPLSLEHKYKSENFSDVFWIVYDEFMPKNRSGFLGSEKERDREYTAAHSLYVTVDRGIGRPFRNETHMIFIGNNFTYYNPIYTSLGIDKYLTSDAKYIAPKGTLWVVEQTGEVEATKGYKQSYGYGLANEALRGYNYANMSLAESGETSFVEKIEAPMTGLGNYSYMGRQYGVSYVRGKGVLYVSTRPIPGMITYSLTTEDHRIDWWMAQTYRESALLVSLRDMLAKGCVRFQTRRAMQDLFDYLKLT